MLLPSTPLVMLPTLVYPTPPHPPRLLEMGFKEEVSEIVRLAPRQRQTMLFSATFSEGVQKLAALSLRSPVRTQHVNSRQAAGHEHVRA